jgi:hypothetical protein
MTLQRLEEILAAYGADRRRWPEAEREMASALLARWPGLRRRVDAARALDSLLDCSMIDISEGSFAVVEAGIEREFVTLKEMGAAPGPANGGWGAMLWDAIAATWPRAAALASVALLGIVIGLASEPLYSSVPDSGGLLDVSVGSSETALLDGLD